MARKEPFKRISVADRIYAALNKKRLADSEGEFRPLPMNAYCERILWDFATGRIVRKEADPADVPGLSSTAWEVQDHDRHKHRK